VAPAESFLCGDFVERFGFSRSHSLDPFGRASNCVQELFARDRINAAVLDRLSRDPFLSGHGRRERNHELARGAYLFSIRVSLELNLDPITSDDHLRDMLRNEVLV
jgi:hypothetical protein